ADALDDAVEPIAGFVLRVDAQRGFEDLRDHLLFQPDQHARMPVEHLAKGQAPDIGERIVPDTAESEDVGYLPEVAFVSAASGRKKSKIASLMRLARTKPPCSSSSGSSGSFTRILA